VKLLSVARKLCTIEERRKEQNYFFGKDITGTSHKPEKSWVRVPVKMGLGMMMMMMIIIIIIIIISAIFQ
jgi:hypothetical protein